MATPVVKGTCYDTATPARALTVAITVKVKAVTATSNGTEITIAVLGFASGTGQYNVASNLYTDTPNNQFYVEFNRDSTQQTVTRTGPFAWNVSPCVINPHLP
jgi:hypothetical protein